MAQWAVVVGLGFTLILTFSPQGRRDLTAPLLHTGGCTGSDGVRLC